MDKKRKMSETDKGMLISIGAFGVGSTLLWGWEAFYYWCLLVSFGVMAWIATE